MEKPSNKPTVSVSAIDRREALKWIIGGSALITGYILISYHKIPFPSLPFDQITRTIGESVAPIPDSWYRTLERISVDSTELSKADIDALTKSMQPIDYSRICNSNPSLAMPATKYGMSLPDTMDMIGKKIESNSGLESVDATDGYTLVFEAKDAKKIFLSISKTNMPEKYWQGQEFERARAAKMTYSGVFFPEEKAQAWKDLVDVNNISTLKQEVKPGTYFRGPDGKIIIPKDYGAGMSIDKLVLMIGESGHPPLRIYYSDFKEVAEQNSIMYEKKAVPALDVKELFLYANIDPRKKAWIFHANNYSVCVPPWRQKGLNIIIDQKYEGKYDVPTKLISSGSGAEFFNNAAQVKGVFWMEAIPMPA